METPSRHSFNLDGSLRVFPIPSPIKGDNYTRIEVDSVIINDRAKYDIVNNSIVFIDAADVPNGSVLDVLVVQSEEAIGQLAITSNMDLVATSIDNVNIVGSNITNVNTVAGNTTNINTVSGNTTNINTVATNITNVNTVGTNNTNVTTVATNIAAVNDVSTNMAEVLLADTNAATATTKAGEASASAATASTQAGISTTQAGISTTQAGIATTQAGISTTKAGEAAASASSASGSASTATTQAGISTTKAGEAAASASTATTQAGTATTQAGISTTKAGEASTSASNAASSASSAQASKDAALAALDSFDDRYLGQKASDPTVDNDGDALVSGALYFDTTNDVMKVYEGSQWVAAYASLSGAMLSANNLSDVADAAASRTNLGLGTAAITPSTDYATAAQGVLASTSVQASSTTGSAEVPTGTTAQRDGTPAAGYLRFNSTDTSFEGYDGSAWGSIGGGATGGGSDSIFYENSQTVTTSYTVTATTNAMTAGPITINAGATVTVDTGGRWVVV